MTCSHRSIAAAQIPIAFGNVASILCTTEDKSSDVEIDVASGIFTKASSSFFMFASANSPYLCSIDMNGSATAIIASFMAP